jgi:uncharacterized Zn-binding protein involved in type VI secretion
MIAPAARIGDMTAHGGVIVTGWPTVLIGGMPAARITDMHVCPQVTVLVPHIGGPIIQGALTVLTGMMPQSRVGDMAVCVGPPDMIVQGQFNVLVGDGGAGGGGAGGGGLGGMVGAIMGAVMAGMSSPAPSAPDKPAAPAEPKTGDIVDHANNPFVQKSLTLQQQVKALEKDGWKIKYGEAGKGSYRSKNKKEITIDVNEASDSGRVAQTLAHEAGHANYRGAVDTSSRQAYVDSNLADEGAAAMNNVKVQREIIKNKGGDIGIAGNTANAPKYNKVYDQFEKDGDEAKARKEMGKVFGQGENTSNTNEKYDDYYGGHYDRNFAKPPKKP